MEGRPGCKIKELLVELYEKAGHLKQWWLVRHTAGNLLYIVRVSVMHVHVYRLNIYIHVHV